MSLEENLREAASLGDYNSVKKFVEANVNINSQNAMNGWTALHWAAIRGHGQIVQYLLQKGADPTLKDKCNITAYDVATSAEVKGLLSLDSAARAYTRIFEPQLPIVPNYLQHPKLIPGYSESLNQDRRNPSDASTSDFHSANSNQFSQKSDTFKKPSQSDVQENLNSNHLKMRAALNQSLQQMISNKKIHRLEQHDAFSTFRHHINVADSISSLATASNKRTYRSDVKDSNSTEACASSQKQEKFDDELVLKVRLSDSSDKDFIEVAMPRSEIGFSAVMKLICEELNVPVQNAVKLKKLPNTIVRNDRDVQRFQNYQELELERCSNDKE